MAKWFLTNAPKCLHGERRAFSVNGPAFGKCMGKKQPNLIPCIKPQLRHRDANVKAKTIKCVAQNMAFWSWGRKNTS